MGSMLRVGSLFSGIGGLELGLEMTGHFETVWQVEIDKYARKILAKHWPDVRRHDDVRTFPTDDCDWDCDVICGGFPCQDLSYAGKGAGLHGQRSGLFYELARVVREVGPRYVILENVAALLTRGMGDVLGTMASLGYDCQWHCIPAAYVGAPHIRDRVFILADAKCARTGHESTSASRQKRQSADAHESASIRQEDGSFMPKGFESSSPYPSNDFYANNVFILADSNNPRDRTSQCSNKQQRSTSVKKWKKQSFNRPSGCGENDTHTNNIQRKKRIQEQISQQRNLQGKPGRMGERLGRQWAVEPNVGRVANGVPRRMDRLRCLGNAVVPQVAQVVGQILWEVHCGQYEPQQGQTWREGSCRGT